MAEEKKVDLLDYVVILVKWKKSLILTAIVTAIVSYLSIYFFINEQFDASATIIPVEENSVGGIASLLKNIPADIVGGGVTNTEMSMYNTIIYSRTLLEKVINKFDLIDIYKLDRSDPEHMEKALKRLRDNITVVITDDNAYVISIRANSPSGAALMTNYVIELLNSRIVELKISKAKQNREFLLDRLTEIRKNLKVAEDSLLVFQKKSGLLSAEDQLKGIMDAYSTLETELIKKQIQKSILEHIVDKDNPKLKNLEIEVNQFQEKLKNIKKEGQPNSPLLSISSLPQKTINYFRLYREVEINNAILEFVMPLYEQAKFEEQKDIPILQVVDYAVPPVKKSYPPRTIFTLLITFGVIIFSFILILFKENDELRNSEKMLYIKKNLFKWKK